MLLGTMFVLIACGDDDETSSKGNKDMVADTLNEALKIIEKEAEEDVKLHPNIL